MENVDNKNKEEVKNEIEDLISEFQEDTDTETEVLDCTDNHIDYITEDVSMRENFLNSMKNHNENYTELLNAYVDNANKSLKNKRSFKSIFFTICCIIMLSITITTVVLTIVGIKSDTKTGNLAVSLGANLLSFLASFIVLPKIIASYLFNNEDEKNLVDIVKNIQSHDKDLRNNIFKK